MFDRRGYGGSDWAQMLARMKKHSHDTEYMNEDWVRKILTQELGRVPVEVFPRNLRESQWPRSLFEDDLDRLVRSLVP